MITPRSDSGHLQTTVLDSDHTYAAPFMYATPLEDIINKEIEKRKPKMFNVQCQTPSHWMKSTDTLCKKTENAETVTQDEDKENVEDDKPKLILPNVSASSVNDTLDTIMSDDPRDSDWTPNVSLIQEEENEDDVYIEENNMYNEKKFIVFESCLDSLFRNCIFCGNLCHISKNTKGSMVAYHTQCSHCSESRSWSSQPMLDQMPAGNLIISASMMFSGINIAACLAMFNFAKIQFLERRSYDEIQTSYIVPCVNDVWLEKQQHLLNERKGMCISVGGDARCCSPGHTAYYGSYTVMDLESSKILDIQLVQSNEVKNSYGMELEGLKRTLHTVTKAGVTIKNMVTDRHSSVKKYMRENCSDINHWFDVWHVAKGN